VVLAASLDLLRGDGEQYRLALGAESLCRRPDRRWAGHWRDPDRHRYPVSFRGSSSEPPPMTQNWPLGRVPINWSLLTLLLGP
jgi:hypothetical protein